MNIFVKGKDFYFLKKNPVAGSTNLIVQGEVGNTITFKLNTDKEHQGLSTLTFKLWYVRRDKQGLDITLGTPTVAEDGTFTIDWTPDRHATYYSGQFVFCLSAYNGTEKVWKTKACPITIAKDVEPEIIDPEEKTLTYDNILSYFEDWVNEKLGQPNGIATLNSEGKVPAEQIDFGIDEDILSLKRLGAYLYEISFNNIPERTDEDNNYIGGCTSFVRDGKLYRNLDWNYDNTAEFRVITKDFEGMSFITGVEDGNFNNKAVKQLPYYVNDGINNYGIMVSSHVLINDWEYAGSGSKNNKLTELPYYILSNVHSINELNTVLSDYLSNIKVNDYLIEAGYLMQFLVTDGTTTYAILPPTTKTGAYQIVNISTNPKLTNFRWLNKATLERNDADLQLHPTGIERWNLINSTTTLEDLRFTLAYESPVRLSEFIGIRGTSKDSSDAELKAIYDIAHAKYLTRTRNGELWQTVHSIVYGRTGVETLFVQEDYNRNYVGTGTKGDKGDPGKSAYQYAVEHGYEGTEAQFGEDINTAISSVDKAKEYADKSKESSDEALVVLSNTQELLERASDIQEYIEKNISKAYKATIGDGRSSYTVTHNLNTMNIIVQLWGRDGSWPFYTIDKINENTIQVDFEESIAQDSVDVVISAIDYSTIEEVNWENVKNVEFMSSEDMIDFLNS